MNWNNINLNNVSERYANLIDGLTFDTLMLEIACNIPAENLNAQTITAQFEEDLQNRVREAREIFQANLNNIVTQSIKERKQNA